MAFCLQGATLVACTRHLKNNLTQYCQDVVGMSRQSRSAVVDAFFGEAGLVTVPDVTAFDAELTKVCDGVLSNMPDKLRQHIDNRYTCISYRLFDSNGSK